MQRFDDYSTLKTEVICTTTYDVVPLAILLEQEEERLVIIPDNHHPTGKTRLTVRLCIPVLRGGI